MKTRLLIACCLPLTAALAQQKTAFQTSSPWRPEIDVRSDVAIVYGANDYPKISFAERVRSWRDRGYQTHFMTGIAWGSYEDYFTGKWDGQNHFGIGQVEQDGDTIWHGRNVPYVVPESSFIRFMQEGVVKKVIDNGISHIHLEEPEFWARAGYSEAFKKEWQQYYGAPWQPQHTSPENTYLSNKLKYHLYFNAIKEVSEYAKRYGREKGMDVKVYIPTHSLVNYSSWRIVSPEASLASLASIDGYIAQVWTGTSREPTFFNGVRKERVFENAFLEYGSMISMTAPTGRKIWLLTDPIEDWPRDWGDYKRNYEATFTAKLLYPMVADYEVMPWPERIYTRPYKLPNSDSSILIPKHYSTQMQIMVNALNTMPVSDNRVSGVNAIGVLMGNSMMFQRFPTHQGFEDPQFSNFYGQTLPLLKRGVPVQTVHMENLAYPATLKDIKVLVMSYSNMKPMQSDVHQHLAEWVRKGGVLVYCGKDDDPYQSVSEWWNMKGNTFKAPSDHLFSLLGLDPAGKGGKVGKGTVHILRSHPKEFVMNAGGDVDYIALIQQAFEKDARAGALTFKNSLYVARGMYDVAAVLDENDHSGPLVIEGPVIDLYDPQLPVLPRKTVEPGKQALLVNIKRVEKPEVPKVLAAAARVYAEARKPGVYRFVAKSPVSTVNAMRVQLPAAFKAVKLTHAGSPVEPLALSWDAPSKTCFLQFDNSPEGVAVEISW